MKKDRVNPDLQKERDAATFDSHEFTIWWSGGKKNYEERKAVEKMFFDDPELKDELPIAYMSHKELYEHSVRKTIKILRKMRNLMNEGKISDPKFALRACASPMLKEGIPFGLHFLMFIPGIISQGTEEQRAEWLTDPLDLSTIGTYAQTELGHGSNLSGLETRADYDATTKEFVLNSTSLTSYKWWPGGLGQFCNHALVVAQLYTQGQLHGLATFIVQLRNMETGMPLPGIDVGEIGPKMSLNSLNNGYLGLKNVRIPLKNMLMKNQQVLVDGTYVPAKNKTLTYGTMVYMRVALLRDISTYLSKAATIATRYAAVRRQGPYDVNMPEPQIMDHVTQQLKLFPQIARAVVIKVTGEHIWTMFKKVFNEVEQGKLDRLPEMHVLSCCLKAVCSVDGAAGIEVCRLACGGHGYMQCSNLPTIYGTGTAVCTYEGENTILLFQTARHLVKIYAETIKSQKLCHIAYIYEVIHGEEFSNFDGSLKSIVEAFQYVAAHKIRIAYEGIEKKVKQGQGPREAESICGIELTKAAEMHGRAFVAQSAYIKLTEATRTCSIELGEVLKTLLELYLIDDCLKQLGDFHRFIKFNSNIVSEMELRLKDCLKSLRPNAVALVDGFDYHDTVLDSALGAYDGNVYEHILEYAQKSPLNKELANKTFYEELKPFINSHL